MTDDDSNALKRHYTEAQIVDIVAVIALFGFLNRYNDTMATELESSPIEAGRRFLAEKAGRSVSMPTKARRQAIPLSLHQEGDD